jgi:uncharacterized RDD family membrane protein YckC
MLVKLVAVKGAGARREILLKRPRTVIGRKTGCSIRIPSALVSRTHCEVLMTDGRHVTVRDLGSANGTFVNGSRIRERQLRSGDQLGVGPITFLVQVSGTPKPSDAPTDQIVPNFESDDGASGFVRVDESEAAGDDPRFFSADDAIDDADGVIEAEIVEAQEGGSADAMPEFVPSDDAESEPAFFVAADAASPANAAPDLAALEGEAAFEVPRERTRDTAPSPQHRSAARPGGSARVTAGRLARLGARLLDGLILVVAAFVSALVIGLPIGFLVGAASHDAQAGGLFGAIGIQIGCIIGMLGISIYQWVLLVRDGQTIGKRMARIQVIRCEDGHPPSFVHGVLLRSWLNALLSQLTCGVYGLVDILFIFREDRRCIHDYLAGTMVVQAG